MEPRFFGRVQIAVIFALPGESPSTVGLASWVLACAPRATPAGFAQKQIRLPHATRAVQTSTQAAVVPRAWSATNPQPSHPRPSTGRTTRARPVSHRTLVVQEKSARLASFAPGTATACPATRVGQASAPRARLVFFVTNVAR